MNNDLDLYGINSVVTDSTDVEFERINENYIDLVEMVDAGADDALIAGIARNLAESFLMVEKRLTAEKGPNNFLNSVTRLSEAFVEKTIAH